MCFVVLKSGMGVCVCVCLSMELVYTWFTENEKVCHLFKKKITGNPRLHFKPNIACEETLWDMHVLFGMHECLLSDCACLFVCVFAEM